jgi:hypothetical protein
VFDLQVKIDTQPAHGTASTVGQSVHYVPAHDFDGTDTFTYHVSDGTDFSNVATVTIQVAPVNDAPVNTALPTIAVSASKPLTLSADDGAWTDDGGAGSLAFAYQWQRASLAGGPANDIAGARSATYVTTSGDAGKFLRVIVTASDTDVPAASTTVISEWFAAKSPANDDLNKAIVLGAGPSSTAGTNIVATRQVGEPSHAGHAAGHSVWWQWKSPKQGGTLTVDTAGSTFDTVLAVYTGSKVNALVQRAANDDAGSSPQSRVSFTVQPNTVYDIAVDGAASSTQVTTGAINLTWSFAPAGPG